MKMPSPRIILVIATLGLAAGAVAAPRAPARSPAVKPADRSLRTNERIDALLKFRLAPDPLPANLANPFQLPAGSLAAETRETNPPDQSGSHKTDPANPVIPVNIDQLPPGSDSEALAVYAASLKITGTVRLNGQAHLIINQSPYKEGDLILLSVQAKSVYLQVIRITPTELTLGLNQAVQTLKLKY